MNLEEILSYRGEIVFILLCLIQISPIKINPWTKIAQFFGHSINGELYEKIEILEKEIEAVEKHALKIEQRVEERSAVSCRIRILRFGDELLHNIKHSKEHFDQILLDINEYQYYCEEHPEFKNNVTKMTIKMIQEVYEKCMEEHSFL